jgi:phage tail tape-measure protein
MGQSLKSLGKKITLVAVAVDLVELTQSDNKPRTAAGIGGAWAGAAAGGMMGAKLGAAIGGLFGGVGAPVGAILGGLIGAAVGGWGGRKLGETAYDMFAVTPEFSP